MAEISKQALKVVNNTNFPNNNSGEISPSDLRSFNVDMIDSTVNQATYTSDSASWNASIDALEQFTSSQQPSFTALNAFTASQIGINSALTGFTSSADSRLDALELETAALESFTASINQIQERGVVKGTSTRLNFGGGAFVTASIVANVGGAIADITINSDTTKTGTGSFNAYTQSTDARINSLEQFTASLDTTYVTQAELAAATGALEDSIDTKLNTSSFDSFSQSIDARVDSLEAATSSFVTSAITASSLTTASFAAGTLTFTKGDGSTFGVTIPDVSGSTIDTGSFATTGSNSFVGNQIISGGLVVSGSQPISFSGSTFLVNTFDGGGPIIFKPGTSIQFLGNTDFTNPGRFPILNVDASGSGYYGFNNEAVGRIYQDFSGSVDARINAITASGGIPAGTVSSSAQITDYGIFATLGGNTFTSSQTITTAGNTDVTIQSTAVSGQTNLVLDAFQNNVTAKGQLSFTNNGQFGGSGSVQFISTLNNVSFASDNGTRVGPTNGGGNGINTQAISLQSHSGSLSLAPQGFTNTTASLSHISSSSGTNFINLMFKNNNNAVTTIVSGSNNIFANPANVTAGFNRYVGGSGNIYLNVVPQLTGSATFPVTMANNISNAGVIFRAPVSSSAYTISSNLLMNGAGTALNIGSSAANHFERAVSGLTITNNLIYGSITATANRTPLSASINLTNNSIGGTVNLNMASSSINYTGNINQGQLVVTNEYFPTTYNSTSAVFAIAGNLNLGSNLIYASGSNATFTGPPRVIQNAVMLGTGNVISASLNGDNAQVVGTLLLGQALNVIGSNSRPSVTEASDWGSVFVGRWNAFDGNRGRTAETVFAVGTGTSGSAGYQRKTGFLIDSGSNTFVEGTLNVSGSTSMTGSLTIQSGSGDLFMYGHKMFNAGAFQSNVTQSGSANVSQSVNFDTTDVSYGVTLSDNSRLNLVNAGTYLITFSLQVLADSGADTFYVWLKKNGANVPESASKLTLANNSAQLATVTFVVDVLANDYYEIAWQSTQGDAVLYTEVASGNIPAIPSAIITLTQVR